MTTNGERDSHTRRRKAARRPATKQPGPPAGPLGGTPTGPADPPQQSAWRDRKLLITLVVFPVFVAVLAAWITGGATWLVGKVKPDPRPEPTPEPVITATQPPRYIPSNPQDQARAEEAGLNMLVSGICPWTVRTVPVPPSQIGVPSNTEMPELYRSYRLSGDANYTRLVLSVIPPESAEPVRVTGVDIRVISRKPAPAPDAATVVALGGNGCGADDSTVYVHALLDGGQEIVPVVLDRGSPSFPQAVGKDDGQLDVEIVVGTTNCDCTWVPVVHWAIGTGEPATTEYRRQGEEFRTMPADQYVKVAWQQELDAGPDGFYDWAKVPFREELLTFDPDLNRPN